MCGLPLTINCLTHISSLIPHQDPSTVQYSHIVSSTHKTQTHTVCILLRSQTHPSLVHTIQSTVSPFKYTHSSLRTYTCQLSHATIELNDLYPENSFNPHDVSHTLSQLRSEITYKIIQTLNNNPPCDTHIVLYKSPKSLTATSIIVSCPPSLEC